MVLMMTESMHRGKLAREGGLVEQLLASRIMHVSSVHCKRGAWVLPAIDGHLDLQDLQRGQIAKSRWQSRPGAICCQVELLQICEAEYCW